MLRIPLYCLGIHKDPSTLGYGVSAYRARLDILGQKRYLQVVSEKLTSLLLPSVVVWTDGTLQPCISSLPPRPTLFGPFPLSLYDAQPLTLPTRPYSGCGVCPSHHNILFTQQQELDQAHIWPWSKLDFSHSSIMSIATFTIRYDLHIFPKSSLRELVLTTRAEHSFYINAGEKIWLNKKFLLYGWKKVECIHSAGLESFHLPIPSLERIDIPSL